tara:strand:+ start:546 stop:1382 length:837 start_codon:yes stop_codon:yes gene_type:complete
MSSDDQSVASGGSAMSASLSKVECPYCNKDFQFRYVFNHLYTKHNTDFFNSLNREWLSKAREDSPLLFWWYYKDDFDEEKQVKLYGCLASKKTFTSECRALNHFKKQPDVLKAHNKELMKLQKQYKKTKQSTISTVTSDNPFQKALMNQDPRLARAFYRRYLYQMSLCVRAVESLKNDYQDSSEFKTGKGECKTTFLRVKENLHYLQSEMAKYIAEKDLNPKHLYSLYYKFEEILNIGRYYTDYGHHFCFRSVENDRGMIQPNDEFYVANDEYPQIDF